MGSETDMEQTDDSTEPPITRRHVLQGAGGTLGALTVGVGSAGATDTKEYNIGTASPAAERAARDAARDVIRILTWNGGQKTITGTFTEEAIENLSQRADVRYTEVNGEMHAIAQKLPWGVDRVDADVAHDNGETGDGADIAIIDTGIDDDHPDLKANIGPGKAFVACGNRSSGGPPCSTANCNEAWSDDHDHGTHCAGIADAVDNTEGVVGVSTAATLHAVKVLDCNGSGSYSDVAAGIKHTADQGWDVGSLSLGGSKSDTVEDAVEYAYGNGVLLVAAAGNDGPCTDCVSYPAAEPEVIAVSATSDDDSLASFSSTGPEIELAAPGEDIYSTIIGDYDTFSGTSMACPHVSGAGGQLMANGYSNTEARDRLNSTAEDISLGDNEQGNGLLDVEAALGLSELSVDSLSAMEVETSDGDAEFDVSWEVSDPEGQLDSLELILEDTTDAETEDSASPSISGETASGTTRLVASGDEGSGNSYDVTATVTDADGNSDSETVSTAETEDSPTVDSLSLSEVETDDSDAEFDADWSVSDDDGDLDTVNLVLYELDSDGNRVEEEDSATESVNGDSASGTLRLVAAGDDGSGNSYEVEATVSDTDGTATSETATEAESEDTSSAPSASIDGISEANSPSPHAEFDVSWSASDDDGDLDTAELTLYDDTDGGTEDSATEDISGGTGNGTNTLKAKFDEGSGNDYTAELVVTDSEGNSDSDTASFSES